MWTHDETDQWFATREAAEDDAGLFGVLREFELPPPPPLSTRTVTHPARAAYSRVSREVLTSTIDIEAVEAHVTQRLEEELVSMGATEAQLKSVAVVVDDDACLDAVVYRAHVPQLIERVAEPAGPVGRPW